MTLTVVTGGSVLETGPLENSLQSENGVEILRLSSFLLKQLEGDVLLYG